MYSPGRVDARSPCTPAPGIPEAPTQQTLTRLLLPVTAVLALIPSCSSPPPALRWQDTGGPLAQDVTTVLPLEHPAGGLLAGHAGGRLSSSSDQGRTWTSLAVLPEGPAVLTLVLQPEQQGRLYAGTADGGFLTTDAGTTWTSLAIDRAHRGACAAIAVDPFDGSVLYAGLHGSGVYRSSDAGMSWTRCDLGIAPALLAGAEVLDLAISPLDPNTVYAALSRAGVMKSTDRGSSWSPLTKELAASGTVPLRLVLHTRTPGLLCFSTLAGDIYRSSNAGETWSPTRQGTGTIAVGALAGDPTSPDRLLATTEAGLMESDDFGRTWTPAAADLPRLPCGLAAGGAVLVAWGEGVGVRRSTDGGKTWQSADRGLGGSTVGRIVQGPRSGEVYAVTGSAVHVYRPSSGSWVAASSGLSGGPVASLAFDADGDSILYAGTPLGVYRSTDAGRSWTGMPRTFGPFPVEFAEMHLAIRTRMFAGTPSGLFVSTDRGSTWKPTRPVGDRFAIRSFTYSPRNAGIIHAATRDRGILGSTDGGLQWESNRYGITGGDILAITRDRDDERAMYCWTASGEGYRSTNRGMEWERYTAPWKSGDRVLLWVDRSGPHRAAALVNGEILHTTSSAGATWAQARVDRLAADAETILWSARESALYVGTRKRGVYRLPLPGAFADGEGGNH